MRNLVGLLLMCLFLCAGCGDDGGLLTEFTVEVKSSDHNAPLEGVAVQLRQSRGIIINEWEDDFQPERALFHTNAQGRVQGHFFSNEGGFSSLRVTVLDAGNLECYPSERLEEGKFNRININALRPTSELRIELSDFKTRTNLNKVIISLTHRPGANGPNCSAMVMNEDVDLDSVTTLTIPIYPFGEYELQAASPSFSHYAFELFEPGESDTTVVIVL